MLKYHKNVEDHRFPHFQHHRKERKITMKKRCLSLLLTLCLLAALAVLSAGGLMGLYYNKYGRKERK